MTSSTPIDAKTKQRIIELRGRAAVHGKPLTYAQIAKLLGLSRQCVMAVVQDAMACRT